MTAAAESSSFSSVLRTSRLQIPSAFRLYPPPIQNRLKKKNLRKKFQVSYRWQPEANHILWGNFTHKYILQTSVTSKPCGLTSLSPFPPSGRRYREHFWLLVGALNKLANLQDNNEKWVLVIYTHAKLVFSKKNLCQVQLGFRFPALSRITSASSAPGPKVYKSLYANTPRCRPCCSSSSSSSSIPRANSRINWHWTLQSGKKPHTHNASFSRNNKPST